MAELMTGKLIYKGEAKNRKRYLVFTTKKGGTWDNPINPDLLSESLRASTEAEVEVAFELDASGRPVRVRAVGEEWKETAPPPAPRRPDDRGRGERGRRSPQRDDHRSDRPPQHQPERLPTDFHNPYNFIPAPPRPKTGSELDDRPPVTHDRYHKELWSGRIAVTLITHTPLLVPDAARATTNDKDHKTYPTRVDKNDRPYLPATSIKGMLRSAYEAVTNSRMGIFAKHESPLAYRVSAGRDSDTRPLIHPARVEMKDGRLQFRIMSKDPRNQSDQSKPLRAYLDKNSLPKGSTDKGAGQIAKRYSNGKLPEHGKAVWVKLSGVWVDDYVPGDLPQPSSDWKFGWACVTGPNIGNKNAERIFLKNDATDSFIPIDDYEGLWRDLILNYQSEHKRELEKRRKSKPPQSPNDYLGDTPGKTGWSRHIDPNQEDGELRESTLCYVELDPNNPRKITAVFPVSISRRLYAVRPADLLDGSIKPAEHPDRLSPADRVFGWVNQNGNGAYRGNLRIGPATLPPPESLMKFDNGGLPLAILGQPKAQQARFYVARSKEFPKKQEDGITKAQAAYERTKGLRGRKVYPHHAGATAASGYWKNPMEDRTQKGIPTENATFFQEYRRPHEGYPEQGEIHLNETSGATHFKIQYRPDKEQRDDQNRSILSWVEPETKFSFEIDITNLSDVELGALLWLLDLNGGQEDQPKLFHRLGGGKPLGFGSVSLCVDWNQTRVSKGGAWEEFYSSFDSDVVRQELNDKGKHCIGLFQDAVAKAYRESDFSQVSFIKAFLVCAEGFNAPIHYPRARPKPDQWKAGAALPPHPKGQAYEWFVQNEQVRDRRPLYALALPDLASKEGLPILNLEKKEQRRRRY